MANKIGANAGFTWVIRDQNERSNYLYFVDPKSTVNPLMTNANLLTVFKKSTAIITNQSNQKDPERVVELLANFADEISKKLTNDQLILLNQKLAPFSKDIELPPELIKRPGEANLLIRNLYGYFHALLGKGDGIGVTDSIIKQGSQENKLLLSLFDEPEKTENIFAFELMKDLLVNSLTEEILLVLSSEEGFSCLLDGFKLNKRAWEQGHEKVYHKINSYSKLDEIGKKITFGKKDIQEAGDKLVEAITNKMTVRQTVVAQKVIAFVQQRENQLFILPGFYLEKVPDLIRESGLRVIGPIKTDLKPRGFFWEVKDSKGNVGYWLGSIHITPARLLNFNSRIQESFNRSRFLAVEVDITRGDLQEKEGLAYLKTLREVQLEEISKLKPEEKEILYKAIRKYLEANPIDSLTSDFTQEKTIALGLLQMYRTAFKDSGLSSGIDLKLIEQAKSTQKTVIDLEMVEDHFAFLSKSEIQAEFSAAQLSKIAQLCTDERALVDTFDAIMKPFIDLLTNRYPEIWEQGFLEELNHYLGGRIGNDPNDKKKLVPRNIKMAQKFDELMQQGTTFGVAGAAHFIGDFSILKFLKEFGYSITQVIHEEPI